jgi:hypothetical protein
LIKIAATRLKLALNVLLKGSTLNQVRGNIPAISDEEIVEIRKFFPLDKFFIFGHARSGTTMLTRLVRLHPEVHCNYQGHFFTRHPTIEGLVDRTEIESWFSRRSNRWNRGRDLSPVIIRTAIDFIMEREAIPLGVKVVGDKSPNSLLNGEAVKLLSKYYPDGRLIFIVRDGRDAAISHRFQSFIDASQHMSKEDWQIRNSIERNPEPFLQGEASVFTPKGLKRAAYGWVKNVKETDSEGKILFGNQYFSLRYEDLLNNPWDKMNEIWEFLGVDVSNPELPMKVEKELDRNPDRDWQHQKAGTLVSSLEKGKSGSWRNLFTVKDQETFLEIAGEVLTTWGYKKGNSI